jgi:predicted transcriptional regulator
MTVMEPVIAWLIACKRTNVTLARVMKGADRPRKPVLRVMDRLVREGYLEEIEDNKIPLKRGEFGKDRRNPTWKVLSKPLFIPKRQAKRRTLRDKMWQLIRTKQRFTVVEIQRLSGAAYDTVRIYIKMLKDDGYVRQTGTDGNRITWMLVKGHKQVDRPETKENRKPRGSRTAKKRPAAVEVVK